VGWCIQLPAGSGCRVYFPLSGFALTPDGQSYSGVQMAGAGPAGQSRPALHRDLPDDLAGGQTALFWVSICSGHLTVFPVAVDCARATAAIMKQTNSSMAAPIKRFFLVGCCMGSFPNPWFLEVVWIASLITAPLPSGQ
jgi:hypothetical protein